MDINHFQLQELIQNAAVTIYRQLGYTVKSDFDFLSSQHPTEQAIIIAAEKVVYSVVEKLNELECENDDEEGDE